MAQQYISRTTQPLTCERMAAALPSAKAFAWLGADGRYWGQVIGYIGDEAVLLGFDNRGCKTEKGSLRSMERMLADMQATREMLANRE